MLSISPPRLWVIGFGLILLLSSVTLALPHTILSDLLDGARGSYGENGTEFAYTPPASYTGDVLNVTKCFCEDPNPLNPRETWAHYHQIDYFNFHLRQRYSLSMTCNSPELNKRMNPLCWPTKWGIRDAIDEKKVRYPDGNTFTYTIAYDGRWGDAKTEHYSFNRQRRGLPFSSHGTLQMVPKVCDGFCAEHFDGMVAARDLYAPGGEYIKTFHVDTKRTTKIISSYTSYMDIADMCDHCA